MTACLKKERDAVAPDLRTPKKNSWFTKEKSVIGGGLGQTGKSKRRNCSFDAEKHQHLQDKKSMTKFLREQEALKKIEMNLWRDPQNLAGDLDHAAHW
jgi:hypothetical protein